MTPEEALGHGRPRPSARSLPGAAVGRRAAARRHRPGDRQASRRAALRRADRRARHHDRRRRARRHRPREPRARDGDGRHHPQCRHRRHGRPRGAPRRRARRRRRLGTPSRRRSRSCAGEVPAAGVGARSQAGPRSLGDEGPGAGHRRGGRRRRDDVRHLPVELRLAATLARRLLRASAPGRRVRRDSPGRRWRWRAAWRPCPVSPSSRPGSSPTSPSTCPDWPNRRPDGWCRCRTVAARP